MGLAYDQLSELIPFTVPMIAGSANRILKHSVIAPAAAPLDQASVGVSLLTWLRGGRDQLRVGHGLRFAVLVLSMHSGLAASARLSFQMSVGALPHVQAMHAVEILGREVAPRVRGESRAA